MELDQFKTAWHHYDAKLEKAISLNNRLLEIVETQKVKSKLLPLFRQKLAETVLHGAVILLLLLFLAANITALPYALSAALLLAFYGVAISHSANQMLIIARTDYSSDVVSIQSNLAKLQASTLGYARLTILCIPTFLAYPPVISKAIKDLNLSALADFDIIAQSGGSWWTAQLVSSVVLIPVCIWLYSRLTRKNIDKPWVRNFINRSSGRKVTEALEFVNEMEELR